MIYITIDDLKTDSYERFIDSSTEDFPESKDKAELKAIGMCKTLMRARYDVDTIFDDADPVRDEFLVDIIVRLTLAKLFGRNAARKLPSDIKDDYKEAKADLEKINAGKITLELPSANDAEGNPISDSIWGNNTNKDYYI
jgi:phage gp36-like protein